MPIENGRIGEWQIVGRWRFVSGQYVPRVYGYLLAFALACPGLTAGFRTAGLASSIPRPPFFVTAARSRSEAVREIQHFHATFLAQLRQGRCVVVGVAQLHEARAEIGVHL